MNWKVMKRGVDFFDERKRAGKKKLKFSPLVVNLKIDGKYCLGDVWQGWTDLEKRLELMAGLERRNKCQNRKLTAFFTCGCPAVNLYMTGNLYDPTPMDCYITAVYVALLRRKMIPTSMTLVKTHWSRLCIVSKKA